MPIHPGDEERLAAAASRELEALTEEAPIALPAGFVDQVMAAIVLEPLPQPARAFRVALVAGHLRAAAASIGDAWRVVLRGSTPIGVRAQALALVLLLASASLVAAGGATYGAIGILTANSPSTPGPATPSATEPPPSPLPTPAPTPRSAPAANGPTPAPQRPASTEQAGPTQPSEGAHGPGTATPEPTDPDDPRGGSDGRGSGSGSGGDGSTPTPTPSQSDDSGGGGG